jgi:hypothetical protein
MRICRSRVPPLLGPITSLCLGLSGLYSAELQEMLLNRMNQSHNQLSRCKKPTNLWQWAKMLQNLYWTKIMTRGSQITVKILRTTLSYKKYLITRSTLLEIKFNLMTMTFMWKNLILSMSTWDKNMWNLFTKKILSSQGWSFTNTSKS